MNRWVRKLSTVFLIALGAGCGSVTTGTGPRSGNGEPTQPSAAQTEQAARTMEELRALSQRYGELRSIRGHFSGGSWNDDVDRFGGPLHQTLTRLGEILGNPAYTREDVVLWMGEPDAVRRQDSEEDLVYYWRGGHDYLYFVCRDGRVQEAKWEMAYE